MKTKKVGLQKFTEFEKKLNELFKKETITLKDIEAYTDSEKMAVLDKALKMFELYNGNRNKILPFINKVNPIMPKYIQNQTWEYNHNIILSAISNLINRNGMMPDKNSISTESGLSRQTIYNHIKDYSVHPVFLEQIEQFKFLSSKLLARIYQCALKGEIKAAKLYFEIIGKNYNDHVPGNTLIKNQNNYIQINGTVLSQENIKLLSSDQLNTIEDMIKKVLSNGLEVSS